MVEIEIWRYILGAFIMLLGVLLPFAYMLYNNAKLIKFN